MNFLGGAVIATRLVMESASGKNRFVHAQEWAASAPRALIKQLAKGVKEPLTSKLPSLKKLGSSSSATDQR
jgi:hypothetical protein